jgi:hypothetical protein
MGLGVEATNLLKHLSTASDMKEAEDEVAHGSKGAGSLTGSAGIFFEDGVALMVRAVLDLPVTSPVAVELFGLGKGAGKGILNLLADFACSLADDGADASDELFSARKALGDIRGGRTCFYLP